ncbi:MAG: hypothetical protein QG573_3073 [Acidobacteriota bacterium]|nr:hypothetical protein [Acidobacteriota bacterium]
MSRAQVDAGHERDAMNPDSAGTRKWCRCVLAAVLVSAAALGASPVRIHQVDSQAGFVAGTLEGVRVDARGVLTLAADVDSVAQVPEPFAFAVTALADGWAIGTGGEGRVLKVARDGAVSVLFDAPEANVFALLADGDGTLFVGTSPAGKVYRLRPGTEASLEPFFDPGETYIWALARGADGALWVATGTEGHLYRVDAAGKGEMVYDGDDPHLRSLRVERGGGLLIGTAGQGLLLRRSPDGGVRTLYDSTLSEVVAIAEAPGGTVFAAVLASEASLVDLAASRPTAEAAQGGDAGAEPQATVSVVGEGESEPAGAAATGAAGATGSRPAGARGPRSELVAISAAGLVEPVWTSQEETVFTLAWMSRRLFMGTGGEGRLYSVQGVERAADGIAGAPIPPLTVTLDHDFDQRQVVGVAGGEPDWALAAGQGLPVVLTTNAAALYRLTERPSASGTFTSAPLDSGLLARYGVFRWSGEIPGGTSVRVRFRTGSSATPDASWSPWSAASAGVPAGGGWEAAIPPIGNGRFLQWQAELLGEGGRSPRMQLAEASYRQVNQRPRIERFGALDPGQILVPANFNPAEQVYEPSGPNREGIFTSLQPATAGGDLRTKQLWKRGQRTLRWRVADPNGDELRFALEVRAETDPVHWLAVAEDLREEHYGFDATVLPDGRYRFRLTASDRRGNTDVDEGEALTAEQESEPVVIDHSPPTRGRAERRDDGWRVEVTDRLNPLREAMLSIDAGEWQPVAPADGLLDGQSETLLLGGIPPSARLVLLRLADAALNYATFDLSPEVKR